MKLLVLVAAMLLAGIHCASAQETAGHHGVVQAAVAKPSTSSARWLADAPLKSGMARVRVASDALAHLQHGHLDATQVTALADEITAAVNDMFANCKLDPAPDAALHPLLARLLAASQSLRAKPADAAPVSDIHAVLANYETLFSEPIL